MGQHKMPQTHKSRQTVEYGASSIIFIRKDADTGDPKVGGWERKEDRGKELVGGGRA